MLLGLFKIKKRLRELIKRKKELEDEIKSYDTL